jgi:capsular polysaccharide biosynthesis protein
VHVQRRSRRAAILPLTGATPAGDVRASRPDKDDEVPSAEASRGGDSSWPDFWFEAPREATARERDETRVTATQPEPEPAASAGNGAEAQTTTLHEPVAPPPTAAAPPPTRAAPVADEPATLRPRIVGPLEAFVRHPILTLLPLVLLAAVALVIGLQRDPVYTAKARVNVGRADVAPFVLQSVVGGNATLAASYARVISTEKVIRGAARRGGVTPQEAADGLDASPIPGSTLIQVEATGQSTAQAVSLANGGARSLISYVTSVTASREKRAAFKRYRRAQAEVERVQLRLVKLRKGGVSPALSRALVDLEAAKLRASNLANQYRGTAGDPTGGSPLRLIAPAATASSDRASTLERLILIGVAAGLVLGLGLALLVTNRARLRALRE